MIRYIIAMRRPLVIAFHAAVFAASYALAYGFRFDFMLPAEELSRLVNTLPLLVAIRLATFGAFRLYEGLWRYVSTHDLVDILKATTLSSTVFLVAAVIFGGHGFPRAVFVLDSILCATFVSGSRIGMRLIREHRLGLHLGRGSTNAIIVGAGDAGEQLLREISRTPALDYRVVGFVDDASSKRRMRVHGVGVLGTVADLPALVTQHGVAAVLVAIPSAGDEDRRRILRSCMDARVAFKTVPHLGELLSGDSNIGQLRPVNPADLLSRESVRIDADQVRAELGGRRVLVTGAAGSIGAELSRQVAAFGPDVLVLVDQAESPLYVLDIELRRLHPNVKIVPVIADVCNAAKIRRVLMQHAPDVVYHAAAYKHVPLMEDFPLEAIRNNVLGTKAVAEAALEAGARRFVLVSTDKAVHPVGIMGMTKRIAECLVQSLGGRHTCFMAVRFGNVLGSEGSVLPLFLRQIADGGPITLTDPDATRYFMLVSEASQLVLQAGTLGRGGEIFFLDMGEPVRLYDLAHNVIRLCGLEPGRDIEVRVTGLRAGERLSEELVAGAEELAPSDHEKIFVVRNGHFNRETFATDLAELARHADDDDQEAAVAKLRAMACGY